ncbi:MAG: alkaline phosphatase family protein [Planctomycetaceae bacterium]
MKPTTKRVLMVIVDALATRVVEPAMGDGRLPNFAKLARYGQFEPRCWSMFPSITPAATCTLHTGLYPQNHGVAGAYWYDKKTDRVAYYGDDVWAIMAHGHGRYFREFQVSLNYEHLRSPTIYEIARQAGRRTACINSMWFKADVPHEVNLPLLFKLLPGIKSAETLRGPDVLCLADFVTCDPDGNGPLTAPGGVTRRYGFHDETTAGYLLDLASRGPLPDLTVAYFPNNDFESHQEGPLNAVPTLQYVDDALGRLFEARGGFQAFLEETAILITGDHSQSDTIDDESIRGIDLDDVLADLSVVGVGAEWDQGDQVMACPNMRAAQVYLRDGARLRAKVVAELLAEPRIDQVLWAEPSSSKPETYHVATADRGTLVFRSGTGLPYVGRDEFGTTWSWDGDLAVFDATLTDGIVQFGDYPNAFERAAGGFFDEAGHVLVTARLGHEFDLPKVATHPGGSHGSLHALDSTSPLFAAGLPDGMTLPSPSRTVDFVPLALQALGIDFPFAPGQARSP